MVLKTFIVTNNGSQHACASSHLSFLTLFLFTAWPMQDDLLLAVYGDGLYLAHVLQLALRQACLEATDAVQLSALALLHDVGDDLGEL